MTNHPGPRAWDRRLWVHKYPLKVLSIALSNAQTQGAQSPLWLHEACYSTVERV